MLQQWGRRVWTFPEVLLAPTGREISVYVRDSDWKRPISVAKNQFAAQVWRDDAHVARQVPLRLSVILLKSLLIGHSSLTITRAI